jgi:hypothetical protein
MSLCLEILPAVNQFRRRMAEIRPQIKLAVIVATDSHQSFGGKWAR